MGQKSMASPAQRDQLAGPQPVPVGDQDHGWRRGGHCGSRPAAENQPRLTSASVRYFARSGPSALLAPLRWVQPCRLFP